MATTPTLPLFDEPATPSQKPSPDDSSTFSGEAIQVMDHIEQTLDRCIQRVDESVRIAHIERWKKEQLEWAKSCDPVADLKRPWWETLTVTEAQATLARYERAAQQAQSLAADLDPFEDEAELIDQLNRDIAAWDAPEKPEDDGW